MSTVSSGESSRLNDSSQISALRQRRGAFGKGCVAAGALLVASLPLTAEAALPDGRIEFSMYGRMGAAWALTTPQIIQGQSMNLVGNRGAQQPIGTPSIGGRFEEGDYLEPTIRAHIIKPEADQKDGTYVDFVITPAMFARNGSFAGFFANNAPQGTLGIELFQLRRGRQHLHPRAQRLGRRPLLPR